MDSETLRNVRKKLKLSIKKMADELEISPRFLVYRESGARNIPIWLARAVRDLKKFPTKRP